MIRKSHRSSLTWLLLISLFSPGILIAQRERRVVTTPTPTPVQTPRPVATPSPTPTPTPSAVPTLAPTPVLSPSVTAPVAGRPRTLDELRDGIEEILQKPELASAMSAVKVVSLDSGRVLFDRNSDKLMRPASNMKLYTVSAALDRLGPDFRFRTSIFANTRPDATGTIKGDMIVYGRGDPSLATRFYDGDYYKGIDALAARIVEAGVKRVEGDLVGDESYFNGPPYGDGWSWDDLTWYYGAEISALTVDDNSLDVFVKPGPTVGSPALITTGPITPLVRFQNRVTTVERGGKLEISLYRPLGENTIEVGGTVPMGSTGYSGSIGISKPALLFVYMLRSALAQRGVTITGQSRVAPRSAFAPATSAPAGATEIAFLESPPFSIVAAQTLKPSQNLYTELILRTLGKQVGPPPGIIPAPDRTTADDGFDAVRAFLSQVGIDSDSLVLRDGSGLSRGDMVTADATVKLLTYMSRHRHSAFFRDAQPIAGIDGTLKNRFKATSAESNLRAKTGTLSGVTSLSGYVTTAAGERLAFSIMLNNFSSGVTNRSTLDAIGILLAGFSGRS